MTAPSGPKQVQANGNGLVLAGSLMTMIQLHNFLAENIIKHHDKRNYESIIKKVFSLSILYYIFLALGSFGNFCLNSALINRNQYLKPAQVVTDFFKANNIEVIIIEVIYIIAITSVIPNFILVSM